MIGGRGGQGIAAWPDYLVQHKLFVLYHYWQGLPLTRACACMVAGGRVLLLAPKNVCDISAQ